MDIKHIEEASEIRETEPLVLVLGYFDGLHRGHKALFDKARQVADEKGQKVAVLTFYESPQLTFVKGQSDLLLHLTYPKKRYQLFERYGVDLLYLTSFTSQFASQAAELFLDNYIKPLRPSTIVVGFDYHFSSQRCDSRDLAELTQAEVIVIPEVQADGEKISSTRIKHLVQSGQVKEANRLLGYTYSTRGLVVHGDARGRTIGYPTANLAVLDRVFLPADGVYVTEVLIKGKSYRAMTSVGKNITFGGEELRIESHILDFAADIYGESMEIFWLDKIRDMIKFQNAEELIQELKKDKDFTINWQKPLEI